MISDWRVRCPSVICNCHADRWDSWLLNLAIFLVTSIFHAADYAFGSMRCYLRCWHIHFYFIFVEYWKLLILRISIEPHEIWWKLGKCMRLRTSIISSHCVFCQPCLSFFSRNTDPPKKVINVINISTYIQLKFNFKLRGKKIWCDRWNVMWLMSKPPRCQWVPKD